MRERENPVRPGEYGNSPVGREEGDAERRRQARGSDAGQPQPERTSKETTQERAEHAQKHPGDAKVPSAPPVRESKETPKGSR